MHMDHSWYVLNYWQMALQRKSSLIGRDHTQDDPYTKDNFNRLQRV